MVGVCVLLLERLNRLRQEVTVERNRWQCQGEVQMTRSQTTHTFSLSLTHTHRHRNEYTFSICVLSKQIEKTHTRTYPVILQWTKTGKTGKNKSKGRNK